MKTVGHLVGMAPLPPTAQVPASQRRDRDRPGAIVLEGAVVLLVMAFFLMGMIEVGRGILVKETLANAARAGARNASLATGTNASVKADVNAILQNNSLPAVDPTILVNGQSADLSTAQRGDRISVQVAIPVSTVSWTSSLFLQGNTQLSETVVMMKYR